MTLEQLERRVTELKREIDDLRREIEPLRPLKNVAETFGMFADDADFDEVIRLGREYRDQVNSENG